LLNLEKTSRSKEVAFVQEIHVTGSQNPVPQRNVTDGPYSKNVSTLLCSFYFKETYCGDDGRYQLKPLKIYRQVILRLVTI